MKRRGTSRPVDVQDLFTVRDGKLFLSDPLYVPRATSCLIDRPDIRSRRDIGVIQFCMGLGLPRGFRSQVAGDTFT
jgi:hypothetical protein